MLLHDDFFIGWIYSIRILIFTFFYKTDKSKYTSFVFNFLTLSLFCWIQFLRGDKISTDIESIKCIVMSCIIQYLLSDFFCIIKKFGLCYDFKIWWQSRYFDLERNLTTSTVVTNIANSVGMVPLLKCDRSDDVLKNILTKKKICPL